MFWIIRDNERILERMEEVIQEETVRNESCDSKTEQQFHIMKFGDSLE